MSIFNVGDKVTIKELGIIGTINSVVFDSQQKTSYVLEVGGSHISLWKQLCQGHELEFAFEKMVPLRELKYLHDNFNATYRDFDNERNNERCKGCYYDILEMLEPIIEKYEAEE
ncbi:MAG: hypothetical protein KA318_00195 [Nitrosomonas sp.]|nr:hypothetical protein [Nitrosomonas sp.]